MFSLPGIHWAYPCICGWLKGSSLDLGSPTLWKIGWPHVGWPRTSQLGCLASFHVVSSSSRLAWVCSCGGGRISRDREEECKTFVTWPQNWHSHLATFCWPKQGTRSVAIQEVGKYFYQFIGKAAKSCCKGYAGSLMLLKELVFLFVYILCFFFK